MDQGASVKAAALRIALAACLAVSCAKGRKADIATLASNSDQIVFEAGQAALKKKEWEAARQHFRRIVDGFPQSQYGPDARIALGDTYFTEGGTGNYILAVSAYREFLTLYPSHPKSDYAQFQVGESFFKQRNGPDRDQTPTENALAEYEKLLQLYGQSTHAEAARQRVVECRQSLARAEFVAGYFYQRTRQAYRAAIARYESLLTQFPDYRQTDEVLFRIAECLNLTGRGAEARPHLARLLELYPQSPHAEPARRLMGQLSGPAPKGPEPPTTTDGR